MKEKCKFYTMSASVACDRARILLQEGGIPFTELDIEKEDIAHRLLVDIGAGAVPALLSPEGIYVGYTEIWNYVDGSRIHPQGGHNQASAQGDDEEAEVEGEELRLLYDWK